MKNVGVTRLIDHLGRIVIPRELRRTMKIEIGTPIEFFIDDDLIILRKYSAFQSCVVTGDILPDNFECTGGIVLSPRGADILLANIKKREKGDLLI